MQLIHKIISGIAFMLLAITQSYGQTVTQNYVRTRTPNKAIATNNKLDSLSSIKDSVQTTIQYIDGLGRPLQTVQRQASPSAKDVIQPFAYDQLGREATKYLPYSGSATGNGNYNADALSAGSGVFKFYHPSGSTGTQQTNGVPNTLYPLEQTAFEASPLNRVLEQSAPGAAWQLGSAPGAGSSSNTARIVYTTNSDTVFSPITSNNKGSRKVIIYRAIINSNQSRTLNRRVGAATGFYDKGQLYVTIARNENWKPTDGCFGTTEEYKDKEGHVIVKRTYNLKKTRDPATGNQLLTAEMLSTYYVYDDFGNLCFVIPPGANPDDIPTAPSQGLIDNRCYQYRYDERDRLVQKKIPGKGWEYIIYNKLDQPVATQDSMQRKKALQEWTISKYDASGRVVLTGIYQQSGTTAGVDYHASLQAIADTTSAQWETPITTGIGYTANTWPKAWATTLTVSYYDSYIGIPGFPSAYNKTSDTTYSKETTGLLTASKVLVLNTNADYLWTVPYYDKEGRTARTLSQHYVGGTTSLNQYNYDDVQTVYNFQSQPTQQKRYHYLKNTAGTAATLNVTETMYYSYDHMGRKRTTQHQMRDGSNSSQTTFRLAQSDYNEIGQLKTKHLHSINNGTNWLQNIDYRYNPRGWLSHINNANLASDTGKTNSDLNDLFGEELSYDNAITATPQFNGNIASVKWKSGAYNIGGAPTTPSGKIYDYDYDNLNRLRSAVSTSSTAKDNLYGENATYDNMGNITGLGRFDNVPGTGKTQIDTLTYTYRLNSNLIDRIDDASPYTGNAGFRDAVKTTGEYDYDGNGNQTKDQNKGITNVSYNILNLPQVITKNDGSTVVYIYTATGNKLRKIFTAAGNITTTEYDNGIQYDNNVTKIDFIQTEEGRARKSGNKYIYEYDLKDHLGNTRVSITPDTTDATQLTPKVLQESDYYAFGYGIQSLQPTSSPKNEYLYNHKELQEETGLYDYGARFYDPVIGRWGSVDPLAEKGRRWSPYNYAIDNPLRYIDPDGKAIINSTDRVTFTNEDARLLFSTFKQQWQSNGGIKGIHWIEESKTPDIYRHTLDAFRQGKPNVLHYDPDPIRRKARRDIATSVLPSRYSEGLQRDEYPYASTYEGGLGAAVAYVPAEQNSRQGLQELAPLYKTLNDGDAFINIPVPKDEEPDRAPQTVPKFFIPPIPAGEDQTKRKVVRGVETGVTVGAGLYVFYKLLVAGITWECGGCGVLMTP